MTLRQALLRYFTNPDLRVALFVDGQEIRSEGYNRQRLPIRNGIVRGQVRFGPFPNQTRIDEIRLLDGEQSLQTLQRFSEPLPLPPGAEFAHDLEIDIQ